MCALSVDKRISEESTIVRKYNRKYKKQRRNDPSYPTLANSDHLDNLGGEIWIITAKMALAYFFHLLTQFYLLLKNSQIHYLIVQYLCYASR